MKHAESMSGEERRAAYWPALFVFLCAFILIELAGADRLPLIDRDEGWYAEISRTMQETGDWVVPRFRGAVFVGKPVFAFWCQGLSMKLLGASPLTARLPSIICGVITLLLVSFAVRRSLGRTRAWWSVFVLGTSALFIGHSRLAFVDPELLLWIVIAQICLAAIYMGRMHWQIPCILWISAGMGLLTKGPVALGMLAGTAVALALLDVGRNFLSLAAWRRAIGWWKSTRPLPGAAITLVIVLPWGILVHERAPGFLSATLFTSMVGPIFVKPLESRSTLHGIYLAAIWPCFLPWCLMLPAVLVTAWRHRRVPALRFCLAVTVGSLAVIECVQQKMVHYLLPLFPALAVLTGDFLTRAIRNPKFVRVKGWKWGFAGWQLSLYAGGIFVWIVAAKYSSLPRLATVFCSLLLLGVVPLVAILFRRGTDRLAFLAMGWGSLGIAGIIFAIFLPAFGALSALRQASESLRQAGFSGEPVGLVGYSEPSISFYLDGQGDVLGPGFLSSHNPGEWPRWLVISSGQWGQLTANERDQLSILGRFGVISGGSMRANTAIYVTKTRSSPNVIASASER
jgi:4-amino-4-deoxy-L-arabinose transferase-like glycosyltransferase